MSSKKIQVKSGGHIVKFFQKLSRAFLVPIALIAASSLLQGIASIITNETMIGWLPFLGNVWIQYVANLFNKIGSVTMSYLSTIYAVSMAFSLVEDQKEYGAFSGLLGYIAFLTSMNFMITNFDAIYNMYPQNGITTVLGIETVNCGILGGIIIGCVTAAVHKKFKDIKLPMMFSFFQGIRFVPFATIIICALLGQVFPLVWVYVAKGIDQLARAIVVMGPVGPFMYGFVEKLLIPTGLHSIWNTIIRDTAASGTYVFASGAVVEGCRPAFFQYLLEGSLPAGTPLTELVKFLRAGQMPYCIFVAPAIALAIYHCADKDKRSMVKPLCVAAAVTAAFANISEPLDFIFLFSAPILFVIYAFVGGLNWMILYILGNTVGGSVSHVLGLLIYGVLTPGTNWWYIVILGVIEAPIMYAFFRWYIKRFNVKTPGRGGDYDESLAFAAEIANVQQEVSTKETTNPEVLKARMIIEGLGGKENIIEVDSCMSRLRVRYKDDTKINEDIIKRTGAQGIVRIDDENIQIIYGVTVGLIKKSVNKELK